MVVVKPYNLFRVAWKTIIWHVVIMKIWYFVQGVESIRRNIIWWTDRYWFCFMRNMPREIFNFREYVIEIYKHIIIDKLKERYRAGKFCVHHNNNIIYPSIVLFYFPIPNHPACYPLFHLVRSSLYTIYILFVMRSLMLREKFFFLLSIIYCVLLYAFWVST